MIAECKNSKKQVRKSISRVYCRNWKGAIFFRKGQSKTKKEQMLENKQKIAKSFIIFEKGTVMSATIATTIATIATAQPPFKKT